MFPLLDVLMVGLGLWNAHLNHRSFCTLLTILCSIVYKHCIASDVGALLGAIYNSTSGIVKYTG
jgi:hypothetical protein